MPAVLRRPLAPIAAWATISIACGAKPTPPDAPDTRVAVRVADAAPAAEAPPLSPLALPAPAGGPPLPPLSGSTTDLNLTQLSRSTTRFRVEAERAVFERLDAALMGPLIDTFARDPRWRVGLWEGQTVAWPREPRGSTWHSPWGGYLRAEDRTVRAMMRLGPRPAGHPWQDSPLVGHNGPTDRELQVIAWRVDQGPWAGQQAAAVSIDGPGLSLELHELAPELTLSETARLLGALASRVQTLADIQARGDLQRSRTAFLPAGEPSTAAAGLRVTRGAGALEVAGRLNPGGPGWTWARLRDADGAVWQEARVTVATAERLGWDANPEITAWMQSELPLEGLAPARGVVEAWHLPDAGGPPRMTGSWPYELPPAMDGPKVPAPAG